MLGAEFTSQSKMGYYQFHPLTIHWPATSGPGLGQTVPHDTGRRNRKEGA